MALPSFNIASSTVEEDTIETTLQQLSRDPVRVIYKGRTTDDSATEIFINGVSGVALPVPLNSGMCIRGMAVAKGDSATTSNSFVFQGNIINFAGTAAADDAVTITELETTTGFGTLAITVNDTRDEVVVTVTGATGETVDWLVMMEIVCVVTEVQE